jgi:hypothetical protein
VTRGIYRTLAESGYCFVRVKYQITIGAAKPIIEFMELAEQRYRKRRYLPEFDQLPWKEDNDAAVPALRERYAQETQISN